MEHPAKKQKNQPILFSKKESLIKHWIDSPIELCSLVIKFLPFELVKPLEFENDTPHDFDDEPDVAFHGKQISVFKWNWNGDSRDWERSVECVLNSKLETIWEDYNPYKICLVLSDGSHVCWKNYRLYHRQLYGCGFIPLAAEPHELLQFDNDTLLALTNHQLLSVNISTGQVRSEFEWLTGKQDAKLFVDNGIIVFYKSPCIRGMGSLDHMQTELAIPHDGVFGVGAGKLARRIKVDEIKGNCTLAISRLGDPKNVFKTLESPIRSPLIRLNNDYVICIHKNCYVIDTDFEQCIYSSGEILDAIMEEDYFVLLIKCEYCCRLELYSQ